MDPWSENSSDDSDTSAPGGEEETYGRDLSERALRRREQNRLAARRCRERKRARKTGVVSEFKEFQSANTRLRHEVRQLTQHMESLQNILQTHACVLRPGNPERHQSSTNPGAATADAVSLALPLPRTADWVPAPSGTPHAHPPSATVTREPLCGEVDLESATPNRKSTSQSPLVGDHDKELFGISDISLSKLNIDSSCVPSVVLSSTPSVPIACTPSVVLSGTPNIVLSSTPSKPIDYTRGVVASGTPNIPVSGTPTVVSCDTPSVPLCVTPVVAASGTPGVTLSGTSSFAVRRTPVYPMSVAPNVGTSGTPSAVPRGTPYQTPGTLYTGTVYASRTPINIPPKTLSSVHGTLLSGSGWDDKPERMRPATSTSRTATCHGNDIDDVISPTAALFPLQAAPRSTPPLGSGQELPLPVPTVGLQKTEPSRSVTQNTPLAASALISRIQVSFPAHAKQRRMSRTDIRSAAADLSMLVAPPGVVMPNPSGSRAQIPHVTGSKDLAFAQGSRLSPARLTSPKKDDISKQTYYLPVSQPTSVPLLDPTQGTKIPLLDPTQGTKIPPAGASLAGTGSSCSTTVSDSQSHYLKEHIPRVDSPPAVASLAGTGSSGSTTVGDSQSHYLKEHIPRVDIPPDIDESNYSSLTGLDMCQLGMEQSEMDLDVLETPPCYLSADRPSFWPVVTSSASRTVPRAAPQRSNWKKM